VLLCVYFEKRMITLDEINQRSPGSGSAEQTGRDRTEQQQNVNVSGNHRQHIAFEIGEETISVSRPSINWLEAAVVMTWRAAATMAWQEKTLVVQRTSRKSFC
jgi:hypothetical protein